MHLSHRVREMPFHGAKLRLIQVGAEERRIALNEFLKLGHRGIALSGDPKGNGVIQIHDGRERMERERGAKFLRELHKKSGSSECLAARYLTLGGSEDSRSHFSQRYSAAVKPATARSTTIRADLQNTQEISFYDSTPVGSGKALVAASGTRLAAEVQEFHGSHPLRYRSRECGLILPSQSTNDRQFHVRCVPGRSDNVESALARRFEVKFPFSVSCSYYHAGNSVIKAG